MLDTIFLMRKDNTESNLTENIDLNFDTAKYSIIHYIFRIKPASSVSIFKSIVIPYIITALFTYGVLFLIAILTQTPLTERSLDAKIPFLFDFNIAWMFLVSFPFIIVLIVTERRTIPLSINQLFLEKVLSIETKTSQQFFSDWQARFGRRNLFGQLIGIIAGMVAVIGNFSNVTQPGYGTVFITNNQLNILGWWAGFCIFIFYFFTSLYMIRAISTAQFLKEMVNLESSKVTIIPFHPDKCGGLGSVGKIAIRHQYLLSVLGINIILLIWSTQTLSPNPLLAYLIGGGIITYLAAGPIGFMGPLLPFRASMAKEKSRLSRVISNRISIQIKKITDDETNAEISKKDEDQIIRLQRLAELIGQLPVWPFDATTVKRFLASYLFPLLTLLLSLIYRIVEPHLFS